MMIWHQDLYVGERIADREKEIRSAVEKGKYPGDVWLILPAANGKDIFDIRPAMDLGKAAVLKQARMIIGMAGSKKEAIGLVQKMAEDQQKRDGSVDLRRLIR